MKELLNWVSTEAEDFSKEVTTEGDKGIEDHIESCRVGLLIYMYTRKFGEDQIKLDDLAVSK